MTQKKSERKNVKGKKKTKPSSVPANAASTVSREVYEQAVRQADKNFQTAQEFYTQYSDMVDEYKQLVARYNDLAQSCLPVMDLLRRENSFLKKHIDLWNAMLESPDDTLKKLLDEDSCEKLKETVASMTETYNEALKMLKAERDEEHNECTAQ